MASLLGGPALAGSAFGRTIRDIPWIPGQADAPERFHQGSFFTEAERRCVDAITARLIPTDETGPGAREADVVGFIDRQLAGFYGRGERWYMLGPFGQGTDRQGYQSERAPAALYREAIRALDDHCRQAFEGRSFAELPESDQDTLLGRLEEGEIELGAVGGKSFFDLILENSVEGFFCDPLHGGNRDMVGWRLVGFPGARYDYRDVLDHDGRPITLDPVGLMGRAAWTPQ